MRSWHLSIRLLRSDRRPLPWRPYTSPAPLQFTWGVYSHSITQLRQLSSNLHSAPHRNEPSASHPVQQANPSPSTHPYHSLIANYLPSIRSLASKLPSNLRHPPTPSDLLPLTKSTLDRLQIRLKWLTIRSFRPYRTDDYSAFASLFVLLNLILAAIGTTTFLGIFLCLFNKAGMEDLVAHWLSNRLSAACGVEILFDSALVPRWRDGMIRFENVRVSRGGHALGGDAGRLMSLVLGSNTLAADRRVRRPLDLSALQPDHHPSAAEVEEKLCLTSSAPEPDSALANLTHFHLIIASIDVTLSLGRWLDGKGLIRQAEVRGVRGVIDRSHLESWSGDSTEPIDRRAFRKIANVGDFHLEGLIVEDLLVTIFQPNNFRPYTFSIFNATFHKLRKQWLFLDFLSAEQMAGQVDNCLFSLHKPQSITRSNVHAGLYEPLLRSDGQQEVDRETHKRYKTRLSRFRIDGVPIDHLQSNSGDSSAGGPLSWINSGKVDVVADISLPVEIDELDLRTVVREIVDNFEKEIVTQRVGGELAGKPNGWISERPELIKPPLEAPSQDELDQAERRSECALDGGDAKEESSKAEEQVVIELDLRFKDVKATVPIFSSNLSYVNNALVRPIVAFINANRTLIPIRCQVRLDLEEFNGSWTTFDIGLIESVSEQVYSALAYHVGTDSVAHSNRLSKVGRWGIQTTAKAILDALRYHWDAAH